MERQFLRQVASIFSNPSLLGIKGEDANYLSRFTFIFPNKRSMAFFRKYLGEEYDKVHKTPDGFPMPVFSPGMSTISDLFSDLSGAQTADYLTLIVELWKCYSAVQKEHAIAAGVPEADFKEEPLDDFIFWGDLILSDFSDVDQYMVDAKQLFINLKDVNEINSDFSWMSDNQINAVKRLGGVEKKELYKKRFLDTWEILYPLYVNYRDTLKKKGIAYSAMQYRAVAEAVKSSALKLGASATDEEDVIISKLDALGSAVFVGFSAPNNCEKTLMRYFRNKKNLDGTPAGYFYWDYYSDMIKAPQNKSSRLIESCVEEFPSFPEIEDAAKVAKDKSAAAKNGVNDCTFDVYPVSGNMGQTLAASEILKKICGGYDYSAPGFDLRGEALKTAVVIADENLLLPMLSAVPAGFRDVKGRPCVNITMGYPLSATGVASLANLLSAIHVSMRVKNGKSLLYGNVLLDVLTHSYVKSINKNDAEKLRKHIIDSNKFFIGAEEFEDGFENLPDSKGRKRSLNLSAEFKQFLKLLVPNIDGANLISSIVEYQNRVLEYVSNYVSAAEKGYIFQYSDVLNSLKGNNLSILLPRSAYSIIRKTVGNLTVTFKGEPLMGLQIMGALETRALDFDNIIYLSFNEGMFPKTGEQKSCIPYFLRKSFGLPTYETQDSISAYNFYRMIQRAKHVSFVYSTDTEGMKVGEESRFIKQLRYDFGVKPVYHNVNLPMPENFTAKYKKVVKREEDTRNIVNGYFDASPDAEESEYFSASLLNSYIDCPLHFYFSKIMGVEVEAELTDSVDGSVFGSIYHKCMQLIYNKYTEEFATKTITGKFVERLMKELFPSGKTDGSFSGPGSSKLYDFILNGFKDALQVDVIEGENLVIRELVERYIYNTLAADFERACQIGEFSFMGTERMIKGKYLGANFIAFFDRIEKGPDGVVRISDYKTGFFDPALINKYYSEDQRVSIIDDDEIESVLDVLFDMSGGRKPSDKILMQLFVYAMMWEGNGNGNEPGDANDNIDVTIYPVRKIKSQGLVTLRVTKSNIVAFKKRLATLLNDIKSGGEGNDEFKMCKDLSPCGFCDFANICNRGAEVKDE
ncbi:MAG: PD-(D/E)XK nuclease family protein [Bacteroidales bacterium]|jgi:hypothetical protein|nr:PD-(D/E)XK nuclease family protein [Bacteroidales bacterium]MCI1733480.1 PD-(D/E)XK nuclease family protein [Bacteroidales bacterium]